MKRTVIALATLIAGFTAFQAFSDQNSGIAGKITPADGANEVWAISGTDTLKTNPVSGAFAFPAKAGQYKVIVDAKEPYKDAIVESVMVVDGKTTDLGEIKLAQ